MSTARLHPDASALSLCLSEAAEIGALKMETLRSLSEELKAGSNRFGSRRPTASSKTASTSST